MNDVFYVVKLDANHYLSAKFSEIATMSYANRSRFVSCDVARLMLGSALKKYPKAKVVKVTVKKVKKVK